MSVINATRAERRQLARDNAKLPAKLVEVHKDEWPPSMANAKAAPQKVYRSRDYLVQIFSVPGFPDIKRLSISRTTLQGGRWLDNISWDELQRLKSELGYFHRDAIEIYPPDHDVVNVANMRHLWVLAELVPFGWMASL